MAEPSDSSLAFFTKGTAKQWAFIHDLRKDAIRAKADQRCSKKGGPEEFIKLDNWYREKLPNQIKSRKEAHVLYDELVQIAKWRLMMGKYRPKTLDLIRINTDSAVTGVSRKAYKKITQAKNLQQAITMLVNLKGVGPSTASAILSAAFPEEAPFMSDEGMLSTPGVEATDSTIAEYINYSDALRSKLEWLKKHDPDYNWTIHKVDQSLWIYYIARDLKPSLLEAMPRPDEEVNGAISSSTTTATATAAPADVNDDNANDCTSSNEAESLAVSNGVHLHNGNHVDSNSESASVPYSEEDFSQGGEASCSSSVAADSNSQQMANGHNGNGNGAAHHHHHSHHLLEGLHHSTAGDGVPHHLVGLEHPGMVDNGHGGLLEAHHHAYPSLPSTMQPLEPVHHLESPTHHLEMLSPNSVTTTTPSTPPVTDLDAPHAHVTQSNGTSKRPLEEEEANSGVPSIVPSVGGCLTSSTTSSGVGEEEEGEDSSKDGLLDSEDSRGDGGLMMMTPSEENSIDGCTDEQPPMKKQKTLELSSALAAATAAAEE